MVTPGLTSLNDWLAFKGVGLFEAVVGWEKENSNLLPTISYFFWGV